MSQTDQIVFAESNTVQDISGATPFSNSALNYINDINSGVYTQSNTCLLYTSPSPRDRTRSRMPSSA